MQPPGALVLWQREPADRRCLSAHDEAPSLAWVIAWSFRRADNSDADGAPITSRASETARSHPVRARTSATDTPGYTPVRVSSQVAGSGSRTPRSVMTFRGPAPASPRRSRDPGPSPNPTEVTKSPRSTNDLRLCRTTTIASRHEAAISGAPPAPGSRTEGWA